MKTLPLLLFLCCTPCFAGTADPHRYSVSPDLKVFASTDTRSDNERYEDEVRANRAALQQLVVFTLSSWVQGAEAADEAATQTAGAAPGDFTVRLDDDHLGLTWTGERQRRQVELQLDRNSVRLEYRLRFSLNDWFH